MPSPCLLTKVVRITACRYESTARDLAQIFVDMGWELHGMPSYVTTDRSPECLEADKINLWMIQHTCRSTETGSVYLQQGYGGEGGGCKQALALHVLQAQQHATLSSMLSSLLQDCRCLDLPQQRDAESAQPHVRTWSHHDTDNILFAVCST